MLSRVRVVGFYALETDLIQDTSILREAMTLKEEKLKTLYEHRLTVRQIVIEKILLGALLGLAAFAANIVIENFKSDLHRREAQPPDAPADGRLQRD